MPDQSGQQASKANNTIANFIGLWTSNKKLALIFILTPIMIYGGLIMLTGSLLSSLTGWSLIQSAGLVFLIRMCLT